MEQPKQQPLVSVIVPIYRVEEYIHRAVDSLIDQTLKETEIILVDDGSPDNCGAIIDEYKRKYSNIVVIHKENGGASDARNAGIKAASGKYIGFVDPDDYAEPDMLEKMVKSAQENDSDLVFCGYREVFSDTYKENRTLENIAELKTAEDIIVTSVNGSVGAYVWNKLFKNSIFNEQKVLFPKNIAVGEDQILFFEYLKYVKRFSVVTECLYNYIRNNTSACAKYHKKQFDFYKAGFYAQENTLRFFGYAECDGIWKKHKTNFLHTLLGVLDTQASVRNKTSIKARYKEMCRLIEDPELIGLINGYGEKLTGKPDQKKMRYIRSGRKKGLFVCEFIRMRIGARIKYYLNIGG